MKRLLKILSLMLVLAVCVSLTGCKELEKMRKEQGVWDNGNIRVGSTEYILLPSCESLKPDYRYNENTVSVTEKDVPVLLSGFIGTTFQKTNDGIFLLNYSDYYVASENYTQIYCRSDKYDSVTEHISKENYFDGYCYSYIDYSTYFDDDEWGSVKYHIFSAEEAEALEKALKSVKPTVMPDIADITYEYQVYIERCSNDLLFREDAFDLSVSDNRYFITAAEGDDSLLYEIPEEYNTVFESIMADSVNSEQKLAETMSY